MAFWDNVVLLPGLRAGIAHALFRGEQGIGGPGKPVRRRDKNVRHWAVDLARALLYFLDAVRLRKVFAQQLRAGADLVILDRYIYDQMANLPLKNRVARGYVRLLNTMVPQPDLALLLDADPAQACARKPEYPVEFMEECRSSYLRLAELVGMRVVPVGSLDEVGRTIEDLLWPRLAPCLSSKAPSLDAVTVA
ncbi:MAG TPA: thymidylate kinase [Terriglobales bacterium]|nr:thymidylate kinase [Terriglobales bacterium]